MENALEIKKLNKAFGDFSISDLSFSLPTGSIMGFIGENGAGKSTTIKLILDLIKRNSGDIKIFGKDNISHGINIKEDVGIVFDESNFPETLRSCDVPHIMRHIYANWDDAVFAKYMRKFELPSKKPFAKYSRGMKMKLVIAVALSHHAKLLILDEATSGLDPIVRDEILDVFLDFIQDEKHSIFISSHIISDLEKIADYITFIHKGQIVFSESKDDLLDKYGILKCSAEDLEGVSPAAVLGSRRSQFGIEALVTRSKVPDGLLVDPASIEEIMLFRVKEAHV